MQMAVASNAFPKEAIESMMEMEKTKAFDELFNEYGIEETQLSLAGEAFKLQEDPQF